MITTALVTTTAVAGTNTTNATYRTFDRSVDVLFAVKGHCTGANAIRRLCAAHRQTHFALPKHCNAGPY